MRASQRLRIVVGGMFVSEPGHGGATWAAAHWVLGLAALGHEVQAVEAVAPSSPVRARQMERYLRTVRQQLGPDLRLAVVQPDDAVIGTPASDLAGFLESADVVIDLAGTLARPPADTTRVGMARLQHVQCRVYVDLDPGFTQLWQAEQGVDMGFDGHTHFATVGLLVGTPECDVPTCGREWLRTPPVIARKQWPVADAPGRDVVTTVANWRSYGSVYAGGRRYGQKCHSFRDVAALGSRSPWPLVLGARVAAEERTDLALLREHRWRLVDPSVNAGTPHRFRRFIERSAVEFGLTKEGYIVSRSGWFSDRSAGYLAAGRPVVAQDTGFSSFLPTGEGLLAATDVDSALDALEDVRQDYPRHARRAAEIAASHFDAPTVLDDLLNKVLS